MPSDNVPLEVAFVCTGNRARSPIAEALFRRYSAGIDVAVSSLGTLDLDAAPALPQAVEAGKRLGVDLQAHRSRGLGKAASLSTADLVLGFEPLHVSAAVERGKARAERTFLLGELVMLLDDASSDADPVARARAAIARAGARRVRWALHSPEVLVTDPLGKPPEVMYRTASEIDRFVRRLVLGLFGPLDSPPPGGEEP